MRGGCPGCTLLCAGTVCGALSFVFLLVAPHAPLARFRVVACSAVGLLSAVMRVLLPFLLANCLCRHTPGCGHVKPQVRGVQCAALQSCSEPAPAQQRREGAGSIRQRLRRGLAAAAHRRWHGPVALCHGLHTAAAGAAAWEGKHGERGVDTSRFTGAVPWHARTMEYSPAAFWRVRATPPCTRRACFVLKQSVVPCTMSTCLRAPRAQNPLLGVGSGSGDPAAGQAPPRREEGRPTPARARWQLVRSAVFGNVGVLLRVHFRLKGLNSAA
jgi:hypothetical protein